MHKKYVVRLSDAERGVCQAILKHLQGSSQQFRRAQILLKADVAGPGWSDAKSAEACNGRVHTIEHLRKRLAPESVARALDGKKRAEPPRLCKLDGEGEAQLSAMRLGKPPAGSGHGTLRLLADAMVALAVVEAISHETVRTTRKNTAGPHARSRPG
jgi:hypothetical protein